MRFTGKLSSWDDQRGFGFIEPDAGGDAIFAHIKSFPAGTGRPQVGQVLTFAVALNAAGKKRAQAIAYPVARRAAKPAKRRETSAAWTWPRVVVIPLFVLLQSYTAMRLGFSPYWLGVYAGASALAFVCYVADKSAAVAGRWRTSENTLHTLALLGGWPGALLAQQLLRHKTSKPGFVAMFWITVALNVAGLSAWQWQHLYR